jgi:transcriptional regulator with XRE-family HTH domain
MSKIGKNIRKIRTVKKLSQASFAEIFNLARPSVGAYEEGRAEPKIDTVIQIANYFGLSTDALLTRDLTINELYRFDSLKTKKSIKGNNKSSKPDLQKKQFNTVFVSSQQSWEYINNFKNADFLDTLPHHHIPKVRSARALAFEMPDESMSYDYAGIHKEDYLICDKQIDKVNSMTDGYVYVLVTKENILVRRLKTKGEKIRFSADHPDTPDLEVARKEIQEIWEASSVLTQNLYPPVKINERISFLEGKLDDMASRLNQLEKSQKGN